MTSADALLAAISTPALAGAACVGRYDVFDAVESDPAPALAICASCSALARCREWAAAQDWPAGIVVAGLITTRQSRPRTKPAGPIPDPPVASLEERAEQLYQEWQKRVSDRHRRPKVRGSA